MGSLEYNEVTGRKKRRKKTGNEDKCAVYGVQQIHETLVWIKLQNVPGKNGTLKVMKKYMAEKRVKSEA